MNNHIRYFGRISVISLALIGLFIISSGVLYAADPPPSASFIVRANTPSVFDVSANQKIAIPYNVYWNGDADPWVTYYAIAYIKVNYDPAKLQFLGACKGFIPASTSPTMHGTNPDGTAYDIISLWWFNPKEPRKSQWDMAFMVLFKSLVTADTTTSISHEHYSWNGWRTYSVHGFKNIPSFFKTLSADEIASSNIDTTDFVAVASVMPRYVEAGQSYYIKSYGSIINFPLLGQNPPAWGNPTFQLAVKKDTTTIDTSTPTAGSYTTRQTKVTTSSTSLTEPADYEVIATETNTTKDASTTTQDAGSTKESVPTETPSLDADPMYTHNGEFRQQVTDLTIPGRGFSFSFKRSYNSRILYDGPLGWNWDFNYNKRLLEEPDTAGFGVGNVVYFDGKGRRLVFTRNPDGTYTRPSGLYNQLAKNSDYKYILRERDGIQYHFGLGGELVLIKDRNNNQMFFYYDKYNRLERIQETLGRSINFAYADSGASRHIAKMTDWYSPGTIPPARTVAFTYDTNNDLITVRSPIVTIGTPTYPNGKSTAYNYSTGYTDIRLNHNMLTVTDPKLQAYLANTYNTTSTSPDKDRLQSQQYGDSATEDTFSVAYTAVPNSLQEQTTVTDRNGNDRYYEHNVLGNATKKRVWHNSTQIDTDFTFNSDGKMTGVTFPEGNSISYTFDITNPNPLAQGNLLAVTRTPDSDRGGIAITTNFTYEPQYHQVKTSSDPRAPTNSARFTTYYYDYEEDTADLNGDGLYGATKQQNGNVIKIVYPAATLPNNFTQTIESKFQYNNYGQVTQAIDPESIVTKYEYYTTGASTGYLWKVIRDYGIGTTYLNITTVYGYESVGNITSIQDGRGNTTTFTVNELNQVTKTTSRPVTIDTSTVNYETRFKYDANDNLEYIEAKDVDEDGNISADWITKTQYHYDILDNMDWKKEYISTSTYAQTSYARDDNENLTDVTQPELNVRKSLYDDLNRTYQTTEGFGSTNPLVTINVYDSNGNLTQTKIGDGGKGTTDYLYDGHNRRIRSTDALGNYTVTGYDANGNVTRTARYNISDQLLSETLYDFDELNRMWQMTEKKFDTIGVTGTDVITTYWHDKKGRRWKVVDDKSNATTTAFDALDRVKSITDALSNKVEYTYDENGNITEIEETEYTQEETPAPQSYTTTNGYDALDRIISAEDNLGNFTYYAYDSRNNQKKTTDRMGNITKNNYDLLNRLIETKYKTSQTADTYITVAYGYDGNSRLTTQTDSNNNITTFGYDAVNRRISEKTADNKLKSYTFGIQYGELYSIVDSNGNSIAHTYDNALRLTDKTITRGTGILGTTYEKYLYDGLNRMTSAQNYFSTATMAYDSLGNLLTETQTIGTKSVKSVVSTYNTVGFKTTLKYPNLRQVTFVPDVLNRINQIKEGTTTTVITDYDYVGPNRVQAKGYGNGITLGVTYDDNRRVTGYEHLLPVTGEDSTLITGFEYAFDKEGNKLYEKRTHESPTVKGDAYAYDAIYRLTGVKYGVPGTELDITTNTYADYTYQTKEDFTLDGVGNRETVTKDTTTEYYNYVSGVYTPDPLNQYKKIDSAILSYDFNGNLKDDGINLYDYDYANRLLKATRKTDSFILAEYQYDALGRRIEKRTYQTGGQANASTSIGGGATGQGTTDGTGTAGALENVSPPPTVTTAKQTGKQQPAVREQGTQRALTNQTTDGTGSGNAADNIGTGSGDGQGLTQGTGTTGALENVTVITHYYYAGARCIAEYDGSTNGTLSRTYLFGNGIDEIIQRLDYGATGLVTNTYYFHENSLGSIYAVTDDTGAVTERYKYDAYGKVTFLNAAGEVIPQGIYPATGGTIRNSHLFTGREYDEETGLYFYRARYYSPSLGRFLQRDRNNDRLANLYAYVSNNPMNRKDPSGLEEKQPSTGVEKKEYTTSSSVDTTGKALFHPEEQPETGVCWALMTGFGIESHTVNLEVGEVFITIEVNNVYALTISGDWEHVTGEQVVEGKLWDVALPANELIDTINRTEQVDFNPNDTTAWGGRKTWGQDGRYAFVTEHSRWDDREPSTFPIMLGNLNIKLTIKIAGAYPQEYTFIFGSYLEIAKTGDKEYNVTEH